jgi:hypothetical protein
VDWNKSSELAEGDIAIVKADKVVKLTTDYSDLHRFKKFV